jgi:hypothetical protein
MNPKLKLWQLHRQAWSRPTADIHALRRALGRKRYNRFRKQLAVWRRKQLLKILHEEGLTCSATVSLDGVGTPARYRHYYERTGASWRTFFRDLAFIRSLYAAHFPDGPETGRCACTTCWTTWTGAGPDTEGEGADAGRVGRAGRAGASPLTSQSRAGQSPTAWEWRRQYIALRLALETLPREMADAALIHARRILARLQPPYRLGGDVARAGAPAPVRVPAPALPPPPPPARAPDRARTSAGDADPDLGLDLGPDTETFVWRM